MSEYHLQAEPMRRWLGPLIAAFADDEVTACGRHGTGQLWFERRGQLHVIDGHVDVDAAAQLEVWLVASGRLQICGGFWRAELADGAVLMGRAEHGPTPAELVLRRPLPGPRSLARLADLDLVPPVALPLLRALLRARRGVLVASPVADHAGLLVDALASALPPTERLLVLAPSGALPFRGPQRVDLDGEGDSAAGAVSPVETWLALGAHRCVACVHGPILVRRALELAAAMPGSLVAMQAAEPVQAVCAVEAAGVASGLPRDAVRALMAAAFSAVVSLGRQVDGSVAITQVVEVTPGPAELELTPLLVLVARAGHESGLAVLTPTGAVPTFFASLAPMGAVLDVRYFDPQTHGMAPTGVEAAAVPAWTGWAPPPLTQPASSAPTPRQRPMAPELGLEPPPAPGAPRPSNGSTNDDPGWELEAAGGDPLPPPAAAPAPPPRDRTGLRAGAVPPVLPAVPPSPTDFAALLRHPPGARPEHAVRPYAPAPPPAHPLMPQLQLEPPARPVAATREPAQPSTDPPPRKE